MIPPWAKSAIVGVICGIYAVVFVHKNIDWSRLIKDSST